MKWTYVHRVNIKPVLQKCLLREEWMNEWMKPWILLNQVTNRTDVQLRK